MNQSESNNTPDQKSSGPISFMANNPIAANLLMIVLIGGGIWTMFNIQKEVFPQYELDIVNVSVAYPGAAPSEVEQGILRPVEEAIRGVQGIAEVTSTAEEGSGSVSIELVVGTDRMKTYQDIDQAVNRIRTFPDNIEEPEVTLESNQQEVMTVGIYGDADIWRLRVIAENVRDQMLSNGAITQVEIGNVPDYVTHVEIPRDRLLEYDLTLSEVADLIRQSSEDVAAGAIQTNTGEILLRMQERKQWAREFGTIELISSENGGSVRLADIADIRDGFEETGFHGQFNRQPTVDLDIFRIGDQSPLVVAEAVEQVLENAQSSFPPGVQYRIDSNAAEDFGERLWLLMENGLLAIIIVMLILALFLEYRLAFWVMMGMTISFVGAIVFLPLIGISINMVSMFGFLVVLGIVVDDAIVVGENIYGYREQGMNFKDAAIKGAREMSRPVTFAILTNIIAFIPLLFMPGVTGKYWWPLPAVVIVVLAVSLFEALFILPAHLSHGKKKERFKAGAIIKKWQQSFSNKFNHFIRTKYSRFLDMCLRNRYVTLSSAVALLIVVGGYGYSDHMGMVMMPEMAADEIEAGVNLPVGTTPRQAAEVAYNITNSTHAMFEENNLYQVAEGIKTNVRGQSFIDVEIVMKPPSERDMSAQELMEMWRDQIGDIAGVDQITFEAERGPGGWRQDIVVDLSHSNIDVLEDATAALVERMEAFDATRNVNDNYDRGKSQFDFKLLEEGRKLGLTSNEVGQQLRDAFFGSLAMRQLRGTNEIEVYVRLPEEERQDIYHLEDYIIQTASGTDVPLMDVVMVEEGEAFTSINRRDGRRVVSVGMDAQPANAVGRVLESMQTEVLPQLRNDFPGITWSFEGSQADMRESTSTLWGGFIIAMFVIYGLLAVAFSSYMQPLIVMGAIPFGVVGAVIGHILLGYDLSLVSLMGVIALSGVVLNDSLIMIDHANRNRSGSSLSALDAIHEAGLRRFRPILLTTLTTFGGLTPIILETSRQAYQLIPMAISLGFGIVFATAIILVIVPCLYMILEDTTTKLRATG
jgi:multidrug efflux pump subunit AcrB